jgi:hypothetical protein
MVFLPRINLVPETRAAKKTLNVKTKEMPMSRHGDMEF